jgi:hypothetical protein
LARATLAGQVGQRPIVNRFSTRCRLKFKTQLREAADSLMPNGEIAVVDDARRGRVEAADDCVSEVWPLAPRTASGIVVGSH